MNLQDIDWPYNALIAGSPSNHTNLIILGSSTLKRLPFYMDPDIINISLGGKKMWELIEYMKKLMHWSTTNNLKPFFMLVGGTNDLIDSTTPKAKWRTLTQGITNIMAHAQEKGHTLILATMHLPPLIQKRFSEEEVYRIQRTVKKVNKIITQLSMHYPLNLMKFSTLKSRIDGPNLDTYNRDDLHFSITTKARIALDIREILEKIKRQEK